MVKAVDKKKRFEPVFGIHKAANFGKPSNFIFIHDNRKLNGYAKKIENFF